MNRKRTPLILAVVLVLVLAGAAVAYQILAPGAEKPKGGDTVPVAADDGTNAVPEDGSQSGQDAAESGEAAEIAAPDFTVYDKEGTEVSLSDLKGRPVVINFWASWCPPCKEELPYFETLWQELGESGSDAASGEDRVVFMMVALTDGQRETKDTVDAFIGDNGYTFPVYYDLDASAAYAYGISSIPQTFFIDENGMIEAYQIGMMDEQTLRDGISKIR